MKNWLTSIWYRNEPPPAALQPLTTLYRRLARRNATQNQAEAVHLPVPVIIVGNIAVGGTGKTPFVIWLIETLRELGWRPGVVSRGYGGRAPAYPLRVTAATSPLHAGDEPALVAQRTGAPVAVAPDRVAAAQLLLAEGGVDVLIADDGLQHYRLARDLEFCVVDGSRGIGNGCCLPAGPLREPPERLAQVDLLVINGALTVPLPADTAPQVAMRLNIEHARRLRDSTERALADFSGQRVHAVAGIGNPERFFSALRSRGIEVIAHPFPDHYRYADVDLCFDDDLPVLMTEKDAVKCGGFDIPDLWAVPATPTLAADDAARVRQLLDRLRR